MKYEQSPLRQWLRQYRASLKNKEGEYGVGKGGLWYQSKKDNKKVYAYHDSLDGDPYKKYIEKYRESQHKLQQSFHVSHPQNPYPPGTSGIISPSYPLMAGSGATLASSNIIYNIGYTSGTSQLFSSTQFKEATENIICKLCGCSDFTFIPDASNSQYEYSLYCCECGAKHRYHIMVTNDNES